MTITRTFTVPDLGGVPPSNAVKIKFSSSCSSLSTGDFKTISAYFMLSLPVISFNEKLSVG
uniref:Uncharacterized protein n=1 Tax=Astyanax mexicanus TaxID=7994 RepID=A0A3B1J217_ASTMX